MHRHRSGVERSLVLVGDHHLVQTASLRQRYCSVLERSVVLLSKHVMYRERSKLQFENHRNEIYTYVGKRDDVILRSC